MAGRELGEAVPDTRRTASRWAIRLLLLAVPLALFGELGHQLLEHLGATLAHHLFHILFAGGAAGAFVLYVAIDVRRHGWPSFSWRIRRNGATAARPAPPVRDGS